MRLNLVKYKKFLLTAILTTFLFNANSQLPKRNIVANSTFEEDLKHWRWDGSSTNAILSVETNNPIAGDKSARINVLKKTEHTWDTNLYTFIPIEEDAKYRVIFSVRSNRDNSRFKVEVCESYDNLTDFKPLDLTSWDNDFIIENPDSEVNDLRGTVLVGTQTKTYEFITQGNQFGYPNYILAFHFGHADIATYWIDNIKISRVDAGDWDGNLFPVGNFESKRPLVHNNQGYFLDGRTSNPMDVAYLDNVNPIAGQKSLYVSKDTNSASNEPIGSIPNTVNPDVDITQRGTKISQLTGDYDNHLKKPVLSQTYTRYGMEGTDLGVPVEDGDTTWVLFGDTWGPNFLRDATGYTTQKNPEDNFKLDFITFNNGLWKPINIPGIRQMEFEVPLDAIVVGDDFYMWHTTDHTPQRTMGRSVLAHATRGRARMNEYTLLYDFSTNKFINVSVQKVNNADYPLLPIQTGEGLIIIGSGEYRQSNVFLAFQPLSGIRDRSTIRYFAGMKDGKPLWNRSEDDAQPIFSFSGLLQGSPDVGELSVAYNKYIRKWILLYNHAFPRGINIRTADNPWGPWTTTRTLFNPLTDGGYGVFMHAPGGSNHLSDPGREGEPGGEYGPYQFRHLAIGDVVAGTTTIYFTMSTWNPYETVLMKASLKRR